jgi:hypothetical protein
MRTPRKTCVQDRNSGLWCAIKGEPDPEAWSDELACGWFMALRGHTEYRVPDCPECRQALRFPQNGES